VVFVTSGELGLKHLQREEAWKIREREAEQAAEVLGVASTSFFRLPDFYVSDGVEEAATALVSVLQREAPQEIYLPHGQEAHPDHRACLPVAWTALQAADIPRPTMLTYEVWTPLAEFDDGKDITRVMARKLKAVRCYRSQIDQFRYDRGVRGLNQFRGVLAWGCRYAEVFQHAYPVSNNPPAPQKEAAIKRTGMPHD
jgi:N-acetylglucosamine malate deacetylase 1